MNVVHVDDMGAGRIQGRRVFTQHGLPPAIPDRGLRALGQAGDIAVPDPALRADGTGGRHANQILHTHFGLMDRLLRQVLIAQAMEKL